MDIVWSAKLLKFKSTYDLNPLPYNPELVQPWEKRILKKLCGKRKMLIFSNFLLFQQWFLAFIDTLTPSQKKPWFLCVCTTTLLKTPWEKEKLLVTSNFSFSHCVFYPFGEVSTIFITFEIVVCKLFQFGSF